MTNRPNQQKLVDDWNAKWPVGHPVAVIQDDKTAIITKTTGGAFVLGGHSTVIMLKGISGCFMLERCHPVRGPA